MTASSFNEDVGVTVVPCLAGIWCYQQYAQDAGKLCDIIENENGADCGTAGTYTIDKSFDIPEEAQASSFIMGMIVVKVHVGDQEACEQQATASSSGHMMLGVASLVCVAGIANYLVKRRGRPLIALEEDEPTPGNLAEMKDRPAGALI